MNGIAGVPLSGLLKPDASTHATPGTTGEHFRDPKLWDTCLKFEALLLQQMMSAMRKTVPKSGLLPSGFANDMHDSMFDQVLSEAGSKRSSLGIANNLYRQLEQLHPAQAKVNATDKSLDIQNNIQGEKHGAY